MAADPVHTFEYRIGWETNAVGHQGYTEWEPWEGPEATEDEVNAALHGGGGTCIGLEDALNDAGFGWWPEIREADRG